MRTLISELDSVLKLMMEQLEVIESFKKQAEELMKTSVKTGQQSDTSIDNHKDTSRFSKAASGLVSKVRGHIRDLEAMLKSAHEVTIHVSQFRCAILPLLLAVLNAECRSYLSYGQ